MKDGQLLYRAADAHEAALIVQVLEANQIPTYHTNGMATIAFGELPSDARQVDIYVADEHMEHGRKLIEEHQDLGKQDQPEAEDWKCASCGEESAASFEVCWSCQTARINVPSAE
ncbi:MAG: hypothetical protein ACI841_002215 [Planctomycetota bacterium]|jgi:hypothetical protein